MPTTTKEWIIQTVSQLPDKDAEQLKGYLEFLTSKSEPKTNPGKEMGQIKPHIEMTPDVLGGKARIAGHRIRVQDIVIEYEWWGRDPDEIVYHYPTITLADVHAALAYYYDNMEEIRNEIREGENRAAELQAKTPSVLQEKLRKRGKASDATVDSVSS
jgi:uncharacterized protein (DUF433 family)